MSLHSVGVFGTSRKKQEKRVPIHPGQLDWIDGKIKKHLFFEEGYGLPFGMSDAQLAKESGGVLSRTDLFQRCDTALLAKL
jgi:N5-(carboxyethyl)ornithine synthase